MMRLRALTAFLTLFFAISANATILITDVTGESFVDNTTTTAPVIFGGTAGAVCSGTDTFSTCDNCATATSLQACNTTRIYNALILRISFQTDTIDNGVAFLRDSTSTNLTYVTTPTSKTKEQVHTIEVRWQEVCTAISDGTTCEGVDLSGNLTLGVLSDADSTTTDTLSVSFKVHDPDIGDTGSFDTIEACTAASVTTGGICDFQAYPGDAKIYINQLGRSDGFPTSGNVTIRALRFFVSSEEDLGTFISNPNQGAATDLEVTTDSAGLPETTSRIIENTNNGILHFVRVATVDQANNVTRFTSNQAIIDYCGFDPTAALPDPVPECLFTAKPDETFGLLEDELNCFITSVAYGSGMDERVGIFKAFRNRILNSTVLGKKIITLYNSYGPYGAVFLQKNSWLKPMVRTLLWPALGFAWTATHWGLWAASLLTLLALSVFILISQRVYRLATSRVNHEK